MEKAARLDALKEHLICLALEAEREADQISATLGYLKHEDAPAQRVQLSGEGGGPVQTKVTIEIVEPQHSGEAPA